MNEEDRQTETPRHRQQWGGHRGEGGAPGSVVTEDVTSVVGSLFNVQMMCASVETCIILLTSVTQYV